MILLLMRDFSDLTAKLQKISRIYTKKTTFLPENLVDSKKSSTFAAQSPNLWLEVRNAAMLRSMDSASAVIVEPNNILTSCI